MKKALIIILTLASLNGLSRLEHNYTRHDCVVIDTNSAYSIIEDSTGNTWRYNDALAIGQIIDLKMHDNYTASQVTDDIIVKVIER